MFIFIIFIWFIFCINLQAHCALCNYSVRMLRNENQRNVIDDIQERIKSVRYKNTLLHYNNNHHSFCVRVCYHIDKFPFVYIHISCIQVLFWLFIFLLLSTASNFLLVRYWIGNHAVWKLFEWTTIPRSDNQKQWKCECKLTLKQRSEHTKRKRKKKRKKLESNYYYKWKRCNTGQTSAPVKAIEHTFSFYFSPF